MTSLVIEVLRIAGETGTVPVTTIALFSNPEPNILGFTAFEGAGAGAPALRLLYTIANPVGLP